MNQISRVPVSAIGDDLTIPPAPSTTPAAFTIPHGPLSAQLRGLARQLDGKIVAGHYRRLPACELSGLRLLAMVMDQTAGRAVIVEDLPPPTRAKRPDMLATIGYVVAASTMGMAVGIWVQRFLLMGGY